MYSKENKRARIIRKEVQKVKEEHFPNLEVRLICRKSINNSTRLVEIVKNKNGVIWGREIAKAKSNHDLEKKINSDEGYLVTRIRGLFSKSPDINITEEIKEAGLNAISHANSLSRLNGWEEVFLRYEYDVTDTKYSEELKFPNRLYCGKERYTTWNGENKEDEIKTPIKAMIDIPPSEDTPKKGTKKEKNAKKTIEWAAEFSEWANGPSIFIYGKDKEKSERIVAIKANNITVNFMGKVYIDKY